MSCEFVLKGVELGKDDRVLYKAEINASSENMVRFMAKKLFSELMAISFCNEKVYIRYFTLRWRKLF